MQPMKPMEGFAFPMYFLVSFSIMQAVKWCIVSAFVSIFLVSQIELYPPSYIWMQLETV